jgi:hypothetical protein
LSSLRIIRAWVVVGCFAGLLAGAAHAGQHSLVGIDNMGNPVPSGWNYTIPDAWEGRYSLFVNSINGNYFEIFGEYGFTSSDPLPIVFNHVSATPVILQMQTWWDFNNSPQVWNGYRLDLTTTSTGGVPDFSFAMTDGSPLLSTWSYGPFDSFTASGGNTTIVFTNPAFPINNGGAIWTPGTMSNVGLAIVPNASATTFTLTKTPSVPEPTAVALLVPTTMLLVRRRARRTRRGLTMR